jgi:predicted dehydrogenase
MTPKFKVGIIGLGRIARGGHAPEIAAHPDKFELAACADIEPERLRNLPKEFEKAKKYNSLEEMLEDPGLDIITICTRHADHVPMALKIMDAGKIAVVEKPVATSTSEMELLRTALKKHPGKLYFRHNRRFEWAFVKARQLLTDGLIGDVQYIKLYRSVGYSRRNDWMTMTEFYGGLLSNWGPHLIDQALCFLDSEVVDIWADVRNVISIGDGDDLFKILLKAENGRLADIEVTGANTMPGRQMEIIGSRGTIIYNDGNKLEARYVDPSIKFKKLKPHPENPPFRYGNFDETLSFVESKFDIPELPTGIYWVHLYNTIAKGIPFPVTFEQAWKVVKITEDVLQKSGFEPIKKFIPQT